MTQRSELWRINEQIDDHIRLYRAAPDTRNEISELEAIIPLLTERECVAEPQLILDDGGADGPWGWKEMSKRLARQLAWWMAEYKEVPTREMPKEGS
jgi:hypothetical protein